jgi:hypothetical protein
MAARKHFLLRVEPELYEALERWAADEIRSVNGQIEYLLHEAVRKAGRDKKKARPARRSPSAAKLAESKSP